MKHKPRDPERRGLSVLEVARMLGCSAKIVRNGIKRGTIPKIDFGSQKLLRIPLAWVDQQLGSGPTEPSGEGC
jgi:hypothetical protein